MSSPNQPSPSLPDEPADRASAGTFDAPVPTVDEASSLVETEKAIAVSPPEVTEPGMDSGSMVTAPEQRIRQLEQALDQAMAALDELRQQVRNQHILEGQLNATEEFSHVQQQAITKLRLQLAEQQQLLETQTQETDERSQIFQELLANLEFAVETQQAELAQLKLRMHRDRQDVQNRHYYLEQQLQASESILSTWRQRVWELESQSLAARTLAMSLEVQLSEAQRQIETLCDTLSHRQLALVEVEAELEQTYATLEEQQALIAMMRQTQVAEQTAAMSALKQELLLANHRIDELESQIMRSSRLQVQQQQAYQDLEAERDRYRSRIVELQEQLSLLQGQISQGHATRSLRNSPEAEPAAPVKQPLARRLRVDLPGFLPHRPKPDL